MASTSERLKELMNTRKLRQVDILTLAEPYCQQYRIKLNKSDLSQFINGKVEPGQWKLTILGLALNVNEAWLMGYDVPMEREHTASDNPKENPLAPDEKALLEAYRTLEGGLKTSVFELVQAFAEVQKEVNNERRG